MLNSATTTRPAAASVARQNQPSISHPCEVNWVAEGQVGTGSSIQVDEAHERSVDTTGCW